MNECPGFLTKEYLPYLLRSAWLAHRSQSLSAQADRLTGEAQICHQNLHFLERNIDFDPKEVIIPSSVVSGGLPFEAFALKMDAVMFRADERLKQLFFDRMMEEIELEAVECHKEVLYPRLFPDDFEHTKFSEFDEIELTYVDPISSIQSERDEHVPQDDQSNTTNTECQETSLTEAIDSAIDAVDKALLKDEIDRLAIWPLKSTQVNDFDMLRDVLNKVVNKPLPKTPPGSPSDYIPLSFLTKLNESHNVESIETNDLSVLTVIQEGISITEPTLIQSASLRLPEPELVESDDDDMSTFYGSFTLSAIQDEFLLRTKDKHKPIIHVKTDECSSLPIIRKKFWVV